MPPEFRPSEGSKKKKEPLKPKEPKTVDDIVDDIMKDYRDRQRDLGNVDNWGQPNENLNRKKVKAWVHKNLPKLQGDEGQANTKGKKRFLPSAPAGLSEAIGSKLKGKSDGQKDKPKTPKVPKIGKPERSTPKTPKVSNPRRSNPSSKEKKAPKPRSPFKRESGSKVRIPPQKKKTGKTSESEKKTPQLKKPSNKESKERLGPKLKMKPPEVRGEKISSKERLRELTNGEYSALKKKKDFPQRMKEAEVHQDLMKKYAGKERLQYGDIAKIAKKLECDPQTVSNWLTKGDSPRLYTYMNWSTPKSEAAERVCKIQDANNGIRNSQDVQKRLDNYYLGPEERAAKFYPRELKKMDKYFEFLDVYKEGGLHLEIAKEVGLSDSGTRAYIEGATPRLVELARQIPAEIPQDGYKWLPKIYEHGGHGGKWSDWIQVPEKVTDYQQVMDVIKHLKPLDNADMRRLGKKYGGDFTREEGFMHLLGTYVSDAKEPSSSTSSSAYGLNLSADKNWNKNFGEATRYHLGQIGIESHQLENIPARKAIVQTPKGLREISMKSQYHWTSENSTVVRWIRRTCLGFEKSAKTYQKIDSDWILKAPKNLRVAFLQGFSDGDGHSDVTNGSFSISTHSNHEFVSKLLESFGIKTSNTETYVRTKNREDFLKTTELPPFKYAKTRLEEMEKATKMIDETRRSMYSNPLSEIEINRIKVMRNEGLSYGDIRERIFQDYGYSLHTFDIWNIVKGNHKYYPKQKKMEKGA